MKILLMVMAGFLVSCGESNINQLFVTDAQKEAYDELIMNATRLYDEGEYADARTEAKKAYELSPDNEEASVLYGYTTLALSGVDTFSIAKNMAGDGDSDTSSSGFLSYIANALGVERSVVESMGTVDEGGSITEFQGYNVILPDDMTTTRAEVANIKYLNDVISIICPFVTLDSVAVDGDSRHSCTSTTKSRTRLGKSHFLWAFAHMGEAVYLNEVLNYANEGATTSNIQVRGEAVNTGKFTPTQLVAAVSSINTTFESVFATGETKAFTALFNDLEGTSKGLAAIGNVPASFTSGISNAFSKIEAAAESVTGKTAENQSAADKTNGLRREFSEAISKGMKDKLSTEIANGNVTGAEKDELCSAWDAISQGQEEIGCP